MYAGMKCLAALALGLSLTGAPVQDATSIATTSVPGPAVVPAAPLPAFAFAPPDEPGVIPLNEVQLATVLGAGDGTEYIVCGGVAILVDVVGENPFGGLFIGAFCHWIWRHASEW